ncbi:MAG: gamma carbonic anhydrase family protein [Actinobacteria bacterium]|nr:gamma carbonic anhydrase family protein [Actinomycetota bacterium]
MSVVGRNVQVRPWRCHNRLAPDGAPWIWRLRVVSAEPLIGALGDHVPSVHPDAWVAPGAVVVGRVTLGRASSVWYGSVLRADDAEIVVGAECNIQDLCCLHVDEGEPAVLEDRVSLGHHAMVHGAHIETGALIGIGAVVLGRAHIGAGTLVAAGTVIRPGSTVPAGVLAAGVPCRVVRELTDADRESFAQTAVNYVRRAARHRAAAWAAPGGAQV